jgi:hypothetical protein
MDKTSFLSKVWQKFHLPREAADVKLALISETTRVVEWTISSKQGDETGWPDYREGLFKKKGDSEICDGVYAVVSCSNSYSMFFKDLQSSCSREGEHKERQDEKGRDYGHEANEVHDRRAKGDRGISYLYLRLIAAYREE